MVLRVCFVFWDGKTWLRKRQLPQNHKWFFALSGQWICFLLVSAPLSRPVQHQVQKIFAFSLFFLLLWHILLFSGGFLHENVFLEVPLFSRRCYSANQVETLLHPRPERALCLARRQRRWSPRRHLQNTFPSMTSWAPAKPQLQPQQSHRLRNWRRKRRGPCHLAQEHCLESQ